MKKYPKRRYDIDILKCIGMFLVCWGHFIGTGVYAFEIPFVLKSSLSAPLLSGCSLIKFDNFLFYNFHIQTAVMGCCLFSLISGFFIPQMQEKYNSGDFPKLWFKQTYRIIPTLAICVIFNGLLAYKLQSISFSIKDYIITCVYGGGYFIKNTQITMPVTWYLGMLSFVYLLSSLIKKFNFQNLTAVYFLLLVLVFSGKITEGFDINWIFKNIAFLSSFSSITLIGTAYYLCKDESFLHRVIRIVFFTFFALLIKATYNPLFSVDDTYAEKNTYIAVCFIMLVVKGLYYFRYKFPIKFKNIIKKIISFHSDLFLPFYLVHVHFGFITMYYLRLNNIRYRYCILAAYIVSLFIAQIISKLAKLFYKYIDYFGGLYAQKANHQNPQ